MTTDRLQRLGFDADAVRRLCASGFLERRRRGVFVAAAAPATELQPLALACAATGGAVCGTTAARLWGFRGVPADPLVHVVVPVERTVRCGPIAGARIHRSADLPAADVVRRRDGISVTSPPRTLFDLAYLVPASALESMIEQGIDRRMFSAPTLWGVARRLARPGRPGSGDFVDVLSRRPAWIRPAGSNDELLVERSVMAAGLPRPVRQHPLALPDGSRVHPDLAWPEVRLAVEVDHVTWHGGRVESSYDKWRDRQVRKLGWEVDRIPDTEVRAALAAVTADVVALFRARAVLLGATTGAASR